MQDLAEEAVNRKLDSLPENLECALVAIDPDTGFIQAMVGGRDYKTNEFNLATPGEASGGLFVQDVHALGSVGRRLFS